MEHRKACSEKKYKNLIRVFSLFVLATSSGVGALNIIDQAVTVAELPFKAVSQLQSSLTRSSRLKAPTQCPTVRLADVKLLLFTRANPKNAVTINPENPTQLQPGKKVIFIIHGWLSNPGSFGFPDLRDEYLKRYDANIIMVDWSVPAWNGYKKCYCFIPQLGKFLANFLCLLEQKFKTPVNSIHMVGHSFGAQMSAFTSQNTAEICGKLVGRITAMDPAKPFYQGIPPNLRLDKDDALFVDVLHTNEGVFGYVGDCGDVDFYVNCGTLQPGCPVINPLDWMDHPIAAVSCEHFRSVEFMAESINSNKFTAKPCKNCPLLCFPDFINAADNIIMGEDCPTNSTGSYVVYTSGGAPYALSLANILRTRL